MRKEEEANVGFVESHKKEFEFPKDPERRMEIFLSSFNVTLKAGTFLLLSEISLTPTGYLISSFKKNIDGSEMSGASDATAPNYCRNTLCPKGLVEEEVRIDHFGKKRSVGFFLTQAGRAYRPIAAFFIFYEKNHGYSLYEVFGASNLPQGEHGGPFARAKIIKALKDGDKRETDLSRELGLKKPVVQAALVSLHDAGVINYSSLKPQTGKEQVSFRLAKEIPISKVGVIKRERRFPLEVVRACIKTVGSGDLITQNNVYERLPIRLKKRLGRKAVAARISTVLSFLEKEGYLERGIYKTHEAFSHASLTEKGREILDNFLLPLEDACCSGGQILNAMRKKVLPTVESQLGNYLVKSADLYHPFSMSRKHKEVKMRRSNFLSVLQKGGKTGLTARDVAEELGEKTSTVRLNLRNLVKFGHAKRKIRNGVFYYSSRPAGSIGIFTV